MTPEYLAIRIDLARFHEGLAELIKKTLQEHPGTIPVRISLVSEGREAKRVKTGDFYSVDTSGDLIAKLKSLLGENSVRVMYPEG